MHRIQEAGGVHHATTSVQDAQGLAHCGKRLLSMFENLVGQDQIE